MWDSDTDPQGAGAAAEPPHPLTFGCVMPAIVTVTIVTHDNEVLDSLEICAVEPVVVEVGRNERECGENGRLTEVLILSVQPNVC